MHFLIDLRVIGLLKIYKNFAVHYLSGACVAGGIAISLACSPTSNHLMKLIVIAGSLIRTLQTTSSRMISCRHYCSGQLLSMLIQIATFACDIQLIFYTRKKLDIA